MPVLKIATNVAKDKVPPGFMEKANTVFQAIIGTPIEYVCVYILTDQDMTFAGTSEPCAVVDVASIGNMGKEENKVLSEKIFGLLKDLGVAGTRAYILFYDSPPEMVGFNGTTVLDFKAQAQKAKSS